MRAGQLRDRVTLQKLSSTKSGRGEEIQSWVDGETFWANVIPLRGSESDNNHERTNEQFFKVRYRPRTDVEKSDRLTWKGYVLEIVTIPMDPTGRGNENFVECKVIL